MKVLIACLVFATALSAQRGGRMGGGMGGGMRGGGMGGGMRGGGFRGSPGNGYGGGGGFVHRPGGGGFVWGGGHSGSYIGYRGFGYGAGFYRYNSFYRPYYNSGYYYPYYGSYISPFWSYPSYYPSDYGSGYPTMSAGPAVTVVSAGAANPTPSTIIVNNTTPRPQPQSEAEDSGLRRPPQDQTEPLRQPEPRADRSQIYLIAARNGIVWAALAYWVEGQTLHFVTVKGERKQILLAQIDRDLSEQFNRERNIPFRLP